MDIKKKIILLLFSLFFLTKTHAAFTNTCHSGTTCQGTLSWQGKPRTFVYHLPSIYADNQRYLTLLIALHGAGDTGSNLEKDTTQGAFDAISEKSHSIIVYPDALNGSWNSEKNNDPTSGDDVGFLRAVIQYFVTNYHANPYRIYVVGMSNGGLMAYRLACDSADIITAIATVAAAMPESLMTSCQPTRHISVLMINGTNDPILPWNSHQIRSVTGAERGTRLSVPETFRAWTKINNIGGAIIQKPVPTTKYDSTWAWMTSAHGFDDTDVVLYTVYGGGHTWPGGSQYLPIHYIGKTNQTFNAAAIAWEFLISHRLTPLTSSSSEK